MTEVVAEVVLNGEKVREEDCDKDSGNQSGDDTDNGDDINMECFKRQACDLDKTGPHCHLEDNDCVQERSTPGSRRNSAAEELKAKIASASRRNSFGSRRSSLASSRRGSVQSIKEDPTCEEECQDTDKGPHCHVPPVPDPTCDNKDACPETVSGDHCHVENGSPPVEEKKLHNGNHSEDGNGPDNDQTCLVKNGDCPDAGAGDHCHENGVDTVTDQGHNNDDDNDVIINDDLVNTTDDDDRKQLLPAAQTNSPGLIVNNPPAELVAITPSPAPTTSNDSTPLTARKIIQTPVNMKEVSGEHSSVGDNMPPAEHNTKETVIMTSRNSPKKEAAPVVEKSAPVSERKVKTPVKEVIPRARSKSRASSPSSESRRSRFSSKERKSSGLEKINHDLPDVTNVKSKLDDKNLAYKPPTSTKRIEVRKLQWKAESKIENNNLDYKKKALQASMENGIDKAQKKIENHKLDWKAEAKTVTRNSSYTPPAKSDKKIETYKVNWSVESKLNTRENINYKSREGGVSPTRSATVIRRQRSRSSHGAERSVETKASSVTTNPGVRPVTSGAVVTTKLTNGVAT